MAVACDASKRPTNEVRIGCLLPITGGLAEAGQTVLNGGVLAVEEINAAGGIASLGGAKLKLVVRDTMGSPETAARETLRLIRQDKVALLTGAYQSSSTQLATQIAESEKTPFLVSVAIADVITERGFHYTFRIGPKAQTYGRDQVLFLVDLSHQTGRPIRRVALVHESTDFGTAVALAEKRTAKEMGLDVVAERSYPGQAADRVDRAVREALAAKPQAILTASYLNDAIAIRRTLAKLEEGIPLVGSAGGMATNQYLRELGSLAESVFTISEYSPLAKGLDGVGARYQARFGTPITGDSAYAYQAVWVLKDALERAASVDHEALRGALSTTDMPHGPAMVLPAKRLRFGPDGQSSDAQLLVLQVQNGVRVPVWPSEFATHKARWPK